MKISGQNQRLTSQDPNPHVTGECVSIRMLHLRWLESWTRQLGSVRVTAHLRSLHKWLWSSWKRDGPNIANEFNTALGLHGVDLVQPDTPHLFAGQIETADLIFININPGWRPSANAIEDSIVAKSENASWAFSRSLFSRYPVEVGRMHWWYQAIGLAWRVICGAAPMTDSAKHKTEWANTHIGGWELFPLHSRSAGFLDKLGSNATGMAILSSMRASLRLAIRFPSRVTIVASKLGAKIANEIAVRENYSRIEVSGRALPPDTQAYAVDQRLLLAVPRPLVSKYSGTSFEEIASAVRRLRDRASQVRGVTLEDETYCSY